MLRCCICGNEFAKISLLRVHLQTHSRLGDLNFPVSCCQGGCKSSFTTVFNFVRHLKNYHQRDETSDDLQSLAACVSAVSHVVSEEVDVQPMHIAQ